MASDKDAMVRVRPLAPEDRSWTARALERVWGSTTVARKGQLVDARALDGFVALTGDEPVGLVTYAMRGDEFEIVTIHAEREGLGIGRALLKAARRRAQELGAKRMWLITTNNNIRAFGFYQRWGMDLVALHVDGVTRSRELKPAIPAVDPAGIPIRHELEFELTLGMGWATISRRVMGHPVAAGRERPAFISPSRTPSR